MFSYVWPMVLIVATNAVCQLCSKSVPHAVNPFASLSISYAVGLVTSLACYFLLNRDANLLREYSQINWAPIVLGIGLVGLEAGFIYAFKAGWPVSAVPVVQCAFLSIVMIFLGFLLYREAITWNKIAGIVICLIGLAVMKR